MVEINIEYDSEVALVWAELLKETAHELGAENFAWHMAEHGCAPNKVREFAHLWERDEFVPPGFAITLREFADQVEALDGVGPDGAWPR